MPDDGLQPIYYRPMGTTSKRRRGRLLKVNSDGTANVIDDHKGGVRLTSDWERRK